MVHHAALGTPARAGDAPREGRALLEGDTVPVATALAPDGRAVVVWSVGGFPGFTNRLVDDAVAGPIDTTPPALAVAWPRSLRVSRGGRITPPRLTVRCWSHATSAQGSGWTPCIARSSPGA